MSLHPTNLAQKAEIIVEHFRQKTAPKIGGQAKAMVVPAPGCTPSAKTSPPDVHHGERVRQRPPRLGTWSRSPALSPTPRPDRHLHRGADERVREKELPKRFAGDDYQVLVVAEKYQTGFDQPLLHTMYVDKKLAGVKAVQTLSRLNRVHPGKDDTFVLDFANTAEDIQAAFDPFFEDRRRPHRPEPPVQPATALLDANVIHPDEMATGVDALLIGGGAGRRHSTRTLTPPSPGTPPSTTTPRTSSAPR